jgi:hypothetical protein
MDYAADLTACGLTAYGLTACRLTACGLMIRARRHGVVSRARERVAAREPPHRQPDASPGAMYVDRLLRVGGAGRLEPARRPEQRTVHRRQQDTVEADEQ